MRGAELRGERKVLFFPRSSQHQGAFLALRLCRSCVFAKGARRGAAQWVHKRKAKSHWAQKSQRDYGPKASTSISACAYVVLLGDATFAKMLLLSLLGPSCLLVALSENISCQKPTTGFVVQLNLSAGCPLGCRAIPRTPVALRTHLDVWGPDGP